MGPEKRMPWPPLNRLGAYLVAVIVGGNAFLHALRSASASCPQASEESLAPFSRDGGRLERILPGLPAPLPEAPARVPSTGQDGTAAEGPGRGVNRITSPGGNRMLLAGPAVEELEALKPEPSDGPASLEPPGRPDSPLPATLDFLESEVFRAELAADLNRRCGRDRMGDLVGSLLKGPEMVFDGIFNLIGGLSGRPTFRTVEEEEGRDVTTRMLYLQVGPRKEQIFATFIHEWAEREQRYLGGYAESRADAYGVQNHTEDADLRELAVDQRKIVWDALRRTYFVRYKSQFEEQFDGEAWEIGRWNCVDFAVLPPLIGGYLYYRGLNRKISMGEMALRISIEPLSEFMHPGVDRPVAAAIEWTVKGFPVGLIVSVGLQDGGLGMDFVGIGTSIATVRGALESQMEDRRR